MWKACFVRKTHTKIASSLFQRRVISSDLLYTSTSGWLAGCETQLLVGFLNLLRVPEGWRLSSLEVVHDWPVVGAGWDLSAFEWRGSLSRSWLWLRAAHVCIGAVILARLATVDRVPVIAVQDALVEYCAWTAQKRVFAAIVAEMVSLTTSLFVGVHAVIVGKTIAREASLGHSRVVWEVLAWNSIHGS